MDASLLIAAGALGLSAIGFFYNLGRDTKSKPEKEPDDSKLDQIYKTIEGMDKKLDGIAQWQQDAAKIHSSHEERIKTLFTRIEHVEGQMEDRKVMITALQLILEKVSSIGRV